MNKIKKRLLIGLCIVSVLLNIMLVGIHATGQQEYVTAVLNDKVKLIWNGDVFEPIDGTTGARLYPLTYQGRTYIPVRAVAEQAGMSVDWDSEKRAVMFGANFNAETGRRYADSTYHEDEK